jgi:hypothetical protein
VDVPRKEQGVKADIVQQTSVAAPVAAPVATPEDSTVSEMVEPEKIATVETEPLKLNGSLPTIVLNPGNDEMPPYEPNNTVIEEYSPEGQGQEKVMDSDDEEEEVKITSLEDQIKDLEEEIERKSSFSGSYQPEEENQDTPVVMETTVPKTSNNVQSSPQAGSHVVNSTKSGPEAAPSSGGGCCRMFLFTFFFVFLTVTVTAIALMSSNLEHPLLTQLRLHLQFVNPVRDYITDRVQSLMS